MNSHLMQKQHFLIAGFQSKTGRALAHFLETQPQWNYSFYEDTISTPLPKTKTTHFPTYVFSASHSWDEILSSIDICILSPGFPRSHPLIQEAMKRNIPVWSEIRFSFFMFEEKFHHPPTHWIGISGSHGKSSTAYFLWHLLQYSSKKTNVFLLGNFGIPLISYIPRMKEEDIVVVELSSYQLEDGEFYHFPYVSLLNILPNHLDHYASFEEYTQTKVKLFLPPRETFQAIYISEDLEKQYRFAPKLSPQQSLHISSSLYEKSLEPKPEANPEKKTAFHMSVQNEMLSISEGAQEISMPIKDIHPSHRVFLENYLPVIALANQEFHVTPEKIIWCLIHAASLPHRNERITTPPEYIIINDSKSTTPSSVIHTIQSYPSEIMLILGGKNKNLDFSVLKPYLPKIQKIFFYGEDGLAIQQVLNHPDGIYVQDFQELVSLALSSLKENIPLILSPGCTSFDQFLSFEERGNRFRSFVYAFFQS